MTSASFSGHVIACTEGGLELFTPSGTPVQVLTVEDGLPSHFCRALRARRRPPSSPRTKGVVSLDSRFRVQPVLDAKWHALPASEGASAEEYVARLGQLAEGLPPGSTYTALSTATSWARRMDGCGSSARSGCGRSPGPCGCSPRSRGA